MRVSQQMLFDRYVFNMNTSLTSLMDLNMQAQTQKKINKPSDDPTGMTRVLDHRDTLRSLEQYKDNIATAKGWLGSADEALTQVSTLITRAKELAQQAATGTLDENNREQISYEIRSLFDQLVGLSNTEFEDNSIFAGQKINGNAFEEIMWLTTNDSAFGNTDFTVQGSSNTTVLVQYYDTSGTLPAGSNMQLSDPNVGVRYSVDGGKTFKTDGSVNWNGTTAEVVLPSSGAGAVFHSDATIKVNDPNDTSTSDGTWMWIRPSVRYLGDTEDTPVDVKQMGPGSINPTITPSATGGFSGRDVTVRIDNTSPVALDEDIQYSYSLDGGINWQSGNIANADTTASHATLSIGSGGILYLNSNGGNQLQPGQQFVVRPRSADIELDISASERITINGIGKEVFGGIFMDPDKAQSGNGAPQALSSSNASVVFQSNAKMAVSIQGVDSSNKNLFEVLGNLIAFTETNNQTGIQQCLENLKTSHDHVMNQSAVVGGRENRLQAGETIIDGLELNEKSLISKIEDADVTELMTDLAQQQIIYESVLRSSSMIMQMNLSKFI